MLRSLILLFVLSIISIPVSAQEIEYETREVITGTNIPWEIRWGHDGWIWFTERDGRFSRVNPETGERKVLLNVPSVLQLLESGMLGFDFHPDFPDSPYIYIAFTHEEEWPARLELFRYTYKDDTLVERISILKGMKSNWTHVGCRVVVYERMIYVSVGEAGDPALAQDINARNGKILRINLDGSIPKDNPLPGNALWSYGHRNPQGLIFSPSGILYSSEHGASTDDEINVIYPGHNYGWPHVEGFCDTELETQSCDSIEIYEPLYSWRAATLGTSGIDFYYHDSIPEWKNAILVAALKDQSLSILKLDPSGYGLKQYRNFYPILTSTGTRAGRLRDICFSPGGRVFVSTSNTLDPDEPIDGIFEIKRKGVRPYSVNMLLPANEAVIVGDSVQFGWHPTAGDSRYHFQLSKHASFSPESIVMDLITEDTTVSALLPQDYSLFFWRVKEVTSNGGWDLVWSFARTLSSVSNPEHPMLSVRLLRDGLYMEVPECHMQSTVRLIDILGTVRRETIISGEAKTLQWRVDDLEAGVYCVTVESQDERIVERIVITR